MRLRKLIFIGGTLRDELEKAGQHGCFAKKQKNKTLF